MDLHSFLVTFKTISVLKISDLPDQNISSQYDNISQVRNFLGKFPDSYFLTPYQKWFFSFPLLLRGCTGILILQCIFMFAKWKGICLKRQIILDYFPQICISMFLQHVQNGRIIHSLSALWESSRKAMMQEQPHIAQAYKLLAY